MNSLNKNLIFFFLGTLVILIFLELGIDYDILDRRIALATTAIFSGGGFLIVYYLLKKKYQIILPWFVALAVVLGVWIDAIGNFAYFYSKYGWWDDFTHFIGSLALALILFYIFYQLNKKGIIKLGRFNLNLLVVSVTMLLVALYEISEFIGDLLFNTQRIGARYDTASDLTYNLLGALLVVFIGDLIVRRRKS